MKRGSLINLILISIFLILTVSFVSAGFWDRFFNPTGFVVTDTCTDSDGGRIYDESGFVQVNSNTAVWDSCDDSTGKLYERYCSCHWTGGFVFSLPFLITGKAIEDESQSDSSEIDPLDRETDRGDYVCSVATETVTCPLGGVCNDGACGCSADYPCQSDPNWNTGVNSACKEGVYPCVDNSYDTSECVGEIGVGDPGTQTSETTCNDEIDNDCDYSVDCADTSCEGKACGRTPGKVCVGGSCVTAQCTPGSPPNPCEVTSNYGICMEGTSTCQSTGQWGVCIPNVQPGTVQEVCGNLENPLDTGGIDEDCDGKSDALDPDADIWCEHNTEYDNCMIVNQADAGFQILSCGNSQEATCTDVDNDGNYDTAQCAEEHGQNVDCDFDKSNDHAGCPSDPNNCGSSTSACAICIHDGAEEICDGLDNDCNPETDESDMYQEDPILCRVNPNAATDSGTCYNVYLECVNGAWEAADCSLYEDLVAPTGEDCSTPYDDNCDGVANENCGCTEDVECTPDEDCMNGIQRCNNRVLSLECEATTEIANCDAQVAASNTCNPKVEKNRPCGTNKGICFKGSQTCGEDGKWGECTGAVKGGDEICANSKDDDCDGTVDERDGCVFSASSNGRGNSQGSGDGTSFGSSSSGGSTIEEGSMASDSLEGSALSGGKKYSTEGKNWWSVFLDFIKAILGFGKSMAGFSVTEVEIEQPCSDSDGGKNYYQKGTGGGVTQSDKRVLFADFCYDGTVNNRVDDCTGEECYLSENYCDGLYVRTESPVVCNFGCAKGACIPDATLNEECRYFDTNEWVWKNRCDQLE